MSLLSFLFSSTCCLLSFVAFYHFFLEQLNTHHFKRCYLLLVLLLSFSIPFITFTEYVTPGQITPSELTVVRTSPPLVEKPLGSAAPDYSSIFWAIGLSIYGIGFALMGIRFARNIHRIFLSVRRYPQHLHRGLTHVLRPDPTIPHSFLHYLFFNQTDYDSGKIPQQVMVHEETHARQLHTIDLLIAEILLVICWFNPVLWIYRHKMVLNHEFLADQGVLRQGADMKGYQNILLDFAIDKRHSGLVHTVNFFSIKKRLTIMKTQTSQRSIVLRSFLILPLLATTITYFGQTQTRVKSDTELEARPPSTTSHVPVDVDERAKRTVELAGLILDSESLEPLPSVKVYDGQGMELTTSDENGYFIVLMDDLNPGEIRFEIQLQKHRYQTLIQQEHWGNLSGAVKGIFFFGLQKKGARSPQFSELAINHHNTSYQGVMQSYPEVKNRIDFEIRLNEAKEGNDQVLFEVHEQLYLVSNDAWVRIKSPQDLVLIDDDRVVRASEIDRFVSRQEIKGMTPLEPGLRAQYAISL